MGWSDLSLSTVLSLIYIYIPLSPSPTTTTNHRRGHRAVPHEQQLRGDDAGPAARVQARLHRVAVAAEQEGADGEAARIPQEEEGQEGGEVQADGEGKKWL